MHTLYAKMHICILARLYAYLVCIIWIDGSRSITVCTTRVGVRAFMYECILLASSMYAACMHACMYGVLLLASRSRSSLIVAAYIL